MERAGLYQDKTWCMAEVEIFCDLSEAEIDAIAAARSRRRSRPSRRLSVS